MPCVIVCTDSAGKILVASAPEAPPELLQNAQPAQSLEEACQMVQDVLGAGQNDQQGGEEAGEDPSVPEKETGPGEGPDAMQAGWNRAKGGL